MRTEINFSTTKKDCELIGKIVDRAFKETDIGDVQDRMTTHMDLTACHANGCEIDLARMLAAPKLDFVHDLYGIRRHINRRTGKLEDCFVPRCAMAGEPVNG